MENSWENLDSRLKNSLKVLIGFVPAFACFALTKDWWFLAYFGAFIWFGITGFRNILQSVLGGGGINRSHLLRWNDYVSWDRMTDSLLFTGFSVPLLDYFVKTLLLDTGFGINVATNSSALYAIMALANGIYLSTRVWSQAEWQKLAEVQTLLYRNISRDGIEIHALDRATDGD